jgi:hypothetical protein
MEVPSRIVFGYSLKARSMSSKIAHGHRRCPPRNSARHEIIVLLRAV